MPGDGEETKKKILEATLELLATVGIGGVTIQEICRRADVNIAAVNYHFGTKENVIKLSLISFFKNIREMLFGFDDPNLPPKERLKAFFKNYIQTVFRKYPGIIRSQVGLFAREMPNPEFFEMAGNVFEYIGGLISQASGFTDKKLLRIKAAQCFFSIAHPVWFTPMSAKLTGIDLNNEAEMDMYINHLIDSILLIG